MATNKKAVKKAAAKAPRKKAPSRAEFEALNHNLKIAEAENAKLRDQLSQTQANRKAQNDELADRIVDNDEILVVDKMLGLMKPLNRFQQKTVVASFLSSLLERKRAWLSDRKKENLNASVALAAANFGLEQQECDLKEFQEIIASFK